MTLDLFGGAAEVPHLDWGHGFASEAKLAIVVVAPAPDRPGARNGTRMLVARVQLYDISQPADGRPGVKRGPRELSPSCSSLFCPQQRTVPSSISAHE
jgi:hypothetical protein